MTTRRRLLIWTENYWIGGCDRFVADLVTGLREDPVDVVLAGNPHPAFDDWLAERIPWALPRVVVPVANLVDTPLHRLDGWRGRPDSRPGDGSVGVAAPTGGGDRPVVRAGVAAARYAQASLNLARLTRLMRRLAPDSVLINNGGYPGAESCRVAAIAARRAGVPRTVQFVHNMASEPGWPGPVERGLDRRVDGALYRWATAAGRASLRLAAARGITSDRIETIHYGIPTPPSSDGPDPALRAELGFGDGGPGLAVIANLERRKGLSVLLRALAQLRDDGTMLPAAIVGEGPMREPLEREIAALGLTDRVRLLGWRDDVAEIMAEADLLTLPSLGEECLPYVILEAMGRSLPVVATDVAGIPEMVRDGDTGRVVAPGDASALAAALADVLSDSTRMARMGARGRDRLLREFALEPMVDRMRSLLALHASSRLGAIV